MLADAMIYLVMQADGVTEDEFRALHLGMGNTRPTRGSGAFVAPPPPTARERRAAGDTWGRSRTTSYR
jgi:hypothetical protein